MSMKFKEITKEQFCRELGVPVLSWLFSMNPEDKHVFWKSENGTLYYQGIRPNGDERFCNRFKKNMLGTEWRLSSREGRQEQWGRWQSWTHFA